jgi:hypothetical protein
MGLSGPRVSACLNMIFLTKRLIDVKIIYYHIFLNNGPDPNKNCDSVLQGGFAGHAATVTHPNDSKKHA